MKRIIVLVLCVVFVAGCHQSIDASEDPQGTTDSDVDTDAGSDTLPEEADIYVDDSAKGPIFDGTKSHPFNTIKVALKAASPGDKIYVDDSGNDYEERVVLVDDVQLLSRNFDKSDGGDQAVIKGSGAIPVVTGADGAVIDGFEITGGTLYGVLIDGVDTIVKNCRFHEIIGNEDVFAVHVSNSSGTVIENCEFYDIQTAGDHSYNTNAIYLVESPIEIIGCKLEFIRALGAWPHVWGIQVRDCNPRNGKRLVIRNNEITDMATFEPWTDMYGIMVYNSNYTVIANNLVHFLRADTYNHDSIHEGIHGILVYDSLNVKMSNNVVYDIIRTGSFGDAYGVRIDQCPEFDGRNNIVSDIYATSSAPTPRAYGVLAQAGTVWEYSNVTATTDGDYAGGISGGVGCIGEDPMFVDPGWDFHLASGSPCIDTGDPYLLDEDGSRSDMGIYGGPPDLGADLDTDSDSDTDTDTDSDTDSDSDSDSDSVIDTDTTPPDGCEGVLDFPDPYLEQAIRWAIEKPEGDLYYSDVEGLTGFYASDGG